MALEKNYKGFGVTQAADAAAWRRWLQQNGEQEANVWLVIYRKGSGKTSVAYDEAVDEALCFGWIDSKINKRDAHSYYQFFAQRNPKSNWSAVNKAKVTRLLAAGKMEPPGLAMVALAQTTGTWTALDAVEEGIIPPDLEKRLRQLPPALDHFQAFPKSVKRAILEWIGNAKTADTRQRRIEETATKAQQNLRANQYQPKS